MLTAINAVISGRKTVTTGIPGDPGVFLLIPADMAMLGLSFLSFIYKPSKIASLFNDFRFALNVNLVSLSRCSAQRVLVGGGDYRACWLSN